MVERKDKIYSNVEILDILYNLKAVVQKYRSEQGKGSDILECYVKAVSIAAEEKHKKPDDIFNEIMQPLKEKLVENISAAAVSQPIKLPKGLEGMIEPDKIKALNAMISQIAKTKTEIKTLTTKQPEAASDIKVAVVEQDDMVSRLKREAIAGLNSSRLKLSEADKQKYAAIINDASEIKVKRKALQCEINIPGLEITPTFGMTGRVGGLSSVTKNGTPSTYGNLTKEDVAELISGIGEKKTKNFKTAAKSASEEKVKELAKREKKDADRLSKLKMALPELQDRVSDTFSKMIKDLDGQVLFEALAFDNKKGHDLLKLLSPDTPKENGGLQDSLREDVVKACIWDTNVWSLYKEQEEKNDKRSFYNRLAEQLCSGKQLKTDVINFMSGSDLSKKEADKVIITGNLLPREIAEEMFVKSVFEYGMSLNYHAQFKTENFEQMNNVLEPFGYKISMRQITARRSCPEGAQAVSKAVLDDMHRRNTEEISKELALMYHIGKYLSENKNYEFNQYDRPLDHPERYNLYSQFCALYYNVPIDKAKKNTAYLRHWDIFTGDKANRQAALQVYEEFHKNSFNEHMEYRIIDGMTCGYPVFKELRMIDEKICGVEDVEGTSLFVKSVHHFMERKLAGIVETVNDIAKKGSFFNRKSWLSQTICWHPADKDPHKQVHLLDTKDVYIYKRGDKYCTGTISGIREGDVVFAPILEVADKQGKFNRIINEDTLLVTSSGNKIERPKVPGKTNQKFIDFRSPKQESKQARTGR